ncbi:MAG TPA: hypothetical protein VI815_01485 [Candidatus Nanoarchaeia archaeon]|nr:hypothetical protein [Candidatus Nanoarchaeia archaeon]
MRYKRPDSKNAISLMESSKKEMEFTLSLEVSENSGSTIIRNIYESLRMLGDALLVKRGIQSKDHIEPINELLKLKVNTTRSLNLIENLRILRHNINYYGYSPNVEEVKDFLSFIKDNFKIIYNAVLKEIEK